MSAIVTQAIRRLPTIALIVGAMLGLTLTFHGNTKPVRAQQSDHASGTQQIDRAGVIQQYFAATNRFDPAGAAAMFADNAVYIGSRAGGSCSQATPCSGQAAILQQLQSNAAVHPCFTLREIQVDGAVVWGRNEVRADPYPGIGIERTLNSFIALIPQDKITFLANVSDIADPQTATYAAVNAGTQMPTPLPSRASQCGEAS